MSRRYFRAGVVEAPCGRAEDKDKPWVKKLVAAYHTPEVKQFVLETFKGSVVPGW